MYIHTYKGDLVMNLVVFPCYFQFAYVCMYVHTYVHACYFPWNVDLFAVLNSYGSQSTTRCTKRTLCMQRWRRCWKRKLLSQWRGKWWLRLVYKAVKRGVKSVCPEREFNDSLTIMTALLANHGQSSSMARPFPLNVAIIVCTKTDYAVHCLSWDSP